MIAPLIALVVLPSSAAFRPALARHHRAIPGLRAPPRLPARGVRPLPRRASVCAEQPRKAAASVFPEGTQLAAELRAAKTAEEALQIAKTHQEDLDGWDLALCVSRVAEKNPGFNRDSATDADWRTWEWILRELKTTISTLSPRGLATLAVSLSKLKGGSHRIELLKALERRAVSADLKFDSQSLAGLLWGLSNSRYRPNAALVDELLNKAKNLSGTRTSDHHQTVLALKRLGVAPEALSTVLPPPSPKGTPLPNDKRGGTQRNHVAKAGAGAGTNRKNRKKKGSAGNADDALKGGTPAEGTPPPPPRPGWLF